MLFINRYSLIRNRSLIEQGKVIFTSRDNSLDDFLEKSFQSLLIMYPKFYKMDHLSKLGFLASEVLAPGKSLLEGYSANEVAIIFANAHSSLDTDLRYTDSLKTAASPAIFVYTLPNIVVGEICIRQGIQGENAFFILPNFNASVMVDYVTLVMAQEKTEACLAGWIDVLGEQHDVFLYLVEKKQKAGSVAHTAAELYKIYNADYGKVDC